MNRKDYAQYWLPVSHKFAANYFKWGDIPAGHEIDRLLGCDHFAQYMNRSHEQDPPIDEDLKRLLVLLAGPHGETVLKVYRIQKGLE